MSGPKVLIVKFSAIGDCVMAVPAVSAIRRTHPDAFIAWAVDPRCMAVVDDEQLVSLRYEVPREQWKKGGAGASLRAQMLHFTRLRSYGFDLGYDLQGHSKTAICLRLAGAKRIIASRATDPAVRVLVPVARSAKKRMHTVERNLEVVRSLGEFPADSAPIMPDLTRARQQLTSAWPDGRVVSITVSAGHVKKQYPLEHWAEVARLLQDRGYSIVFLGGKVDRAPVFEGAIDLVGKLPLEGTMVAVASSDLHLAADTGTGHIAAAYGIPVLSIFGHTDPAIYRPYTDTGLVLDAGKTMDGVSPARVAQEALALSDRYGSRVPH